MKGLARKFLLGESMFKATYTAQSAGQSFTAASSYPGNIIASIRRRRTIHISTSRTRKNLAANHVKISPRKPANTISPNQRELEQNRSEQFFFVSTPYNSATSLSIKALPVKGAIRK